MQAVPGLKRNLQAAIAADRLGFAGESDFGVAEQRHAAVERNIKTGADVGAKFAILCARLEVQSAAKENGVNAIVAKAPERRRPIDAIKAKRPSFG